MASLMLSTNVAGLQIQKSQLRFSMGITQTCPFIGSRMIPLMNDEAAAAGAPERTLMPGKRNEKPLIIPRRVRSFIYASQITF